MKKITIPLIIVLSALVDQLTKFFIVTNISLNSSVIVIKNILSFTYIRNTGVSFGMFSNLTIVILILTILILIILTKELKKYFDNKIMLIAYSLVVGGLLGNLIDRTIFGYVRDFIDLNFINFPIFNVSDILITVGIFVLLIYSFKMEVPNGNKSKERIRE